MATLTVNIKDDNDLSVIREILNRFGLVYKIDEDKDFLFSKEEIEALLKSKQDYLEGKTTARNWNDIEDELNSAYN